MKTVQKKRTREVKHYASVDEFVREKQKRMEETLARIDRTDLEELIKKNRS